MWKQRPFVLFDATTGGHLWQSDTLAVQTTTFTASAGSLQVGVEYVYGILLGDFEGDDIENASWTFSAPFRFTSLTVNGDFNLDGTVDAADYVVWRNGLGTLYTQSHYAIWRSHFGQTAGSGAALPSAEPLSAAVPEPATLDTDDFGGGWLVSPPTPGRIESPENSSTRDTRQQPTVSGTITTNPLLSRRRTSTASIDATKFVSKYVRRFDARFARDVFSRAAGSIPAASTS